MAHQRRGYAASAAAEAEERMRRATYAAARSDYATRLYGSDAELSPDAAPRPAARRSVSFTAGAAAARGPFLFHFDADDSDSDSDRSSGGLGEEPALRTAPSEPVLPAASAGLHPRPFQRSQTFSHPPADPSLDASEREALLQRVRQLSAGEAAAAAAAARAQAEAASLAEEVAHWRGVAKEAAAARRASREALGELSAENARLAAALSAARLEAAAAHEALDGERHVMEELSRAFLAAKKRVATLERGSGRRPGSAGLSPGRVNAPPPASPPPPGAAAWDAERQELLSLLERLQEQLAAHAAAQQAQQEPSPAPTGRPPSARRRHASPPSPASPVSASDASEAGTPFRAFYAASSAAGRTPGATPTSTRTPSAAAAAAAGIFPDASPASARTAYKPPRAASAAAASQTPTPEHEPTGPELHCESSFESVATAGAPPSAAATPAAAAPTPPLSAARPPSGDARAAGQTQTPPVPENSEADRMAELKAAGDRAVRHKRYGDAVEQYSAALAAAEAGTADATALASLLCRRAAALAAAGRLLESAADCCRAERAAGPRGCLRAVDLRAEAFSLMGAFDLAAEDLGRLRQGGAAAPAAAARLAAARRAAGDAAPRNHYAVLGVKPGAGADEIKAAYRALALRLHPDKAAAALGRAAATALFSLLSAAHATLSNAAARRTYDLQLLRHKYAGGGGGEGGAAARGGRPPSSWR